MEAETNRRMGEKKMSEENERKEAFLQRKAKCITHMEHHRIYFQPGDRYEKVLFHHCDLHCPEDVGKSIHFNSCVFWGCRYFKGETEVPNIWVALGGDKYVEASDGDKIRAINAEGFRVL
jgi:hypothetical protein